MESTAQRIHKAISELHARAEAQAAEGRAGGGVRPAQTATRQDHDDAQIRWAFWRIANPIRCQADRESSADYKMWEILHQCIQSARRDERERIAASLHVGIETALGPEGRDLLWDVANSAGFLDQD